MDKILEVKGKLDEFAIWEAEKSIFRSKCNYVREGEKISSFFFSLEKKRYAEKNMKCILFDDRSTSTHQATILKEQTCFYRELYRSDEGVAFTLSPAPEENRLSEAERIWTDTPITQDELFDAVMTLKGGKVPGIDGLSIEFYHKFWKVIAPFLIAMYQYSFDQGLLPVLVRKGLISLLPKGNKDTRLVKNMRPLTLLCNSYKILAKALDNRMRTILPELIQMDRTDFVKGRKICHNVRKSLDIIEHMNHKNLPGLILSIDMEKCFDRLEHKSIFGSLKYLNFGDNFIKWVSLFYTGFLVCTQNFGFLSEFWVKQRGDPIRGAH